MKTKVVVDYERCLYLFVQELVGIFPGQNPQAQCIQAELILLLVKYIDMCKYSHSHMDHVC